MRLQPGTRVGKYTLTEPLGEGGMGVVWAALSDGGAHVALKFLRAVDNAKARARFQREAAILERIRSPYVARFLDQGVHKSAGPFVVSERVDGETLERRMLGRGPLGVAELIPFVAQVLSGLDDVHSAGVVHRDIKPSNLVLTSTRQGTSGVKLLDFGVSTLLESTETEWLTSVGATLGTVAFMAPEQANDSRAADARADLYSLGTVIFYALTGRMPYRSTSPAILLALKASCDAPRLGKVRAIDWPSWLEDFVATLLARDPSARHGSAREAQQAWSLASASPERLPPRVSNEDVEQLPAMISETR